MIEKIFYNVFILGTIISICILPILLFLNKNKNKYQFKNIYKLFFIIVLLLFLPVNTFNFSKMKNNFEFAPQNIVFEPLKTNITQGSQKPDLIANEPIYVESNLLFDFFKIVSYIWLSVFVAILIYNISNYLVFLHKLKSTSKFTNNYDNTINRISKSIDLDINIKCYLSENISSPMSIGIFKKKIILPYDISSCEEFELILKHELFHIKNRDLEYKFLLVLLNSIYWFNPIVYNIINQINELLELNCDYNVIKNENKEYKIKYAQALLNQIEKNRRKNYSFSINFANRRKNIMDRFTNIINEPQKKSAVRLATVLTILLILAITTIIAMPTINFAQNSDDKIVDEPQLISDTNTTSDNLTDIPNTSNLEASNGTIEFALPITNISVTSPFYEGTHNGVDFASISGTDIFASADGIVKFAGWANEYGYMVQIEHTNSFETWYSQCSELCVSEGQSVKKGDLIAKVGSTGNSTGPHLHFELHQNSTTLNPENYFNFLISENN